MTGRKRKICVVVNSRANYARIKSVLKTIQDHPATELQLIVGASALLYRFGNVIDIMRGDGFEPHATVYSIVEGENLTTMAKSTGLAVLELATLFENLKPDFALTVADRFETIATAIAASYMNIPVAHTQGGEVTGSIDESVRHAVTKLSHVHFPATKKATENLLRMGEDPAHVYCVGCPSIDLVAGLDLSISKNLIQKYGGVGVTTDPTKPYLVVLQHPVTTQYGQGSAQINETLNAVASIGMQTIWLWPNVDAGSDDISKGLRVYRERHPEAPIHFFRNFSPEDYARLIANAACLLGNSSSALREGAFLGIPAVNIGSRQANREHGPNVVHAPYNSDTIAKCARAQVHHGPYTSSSTFGNGKAGEQIARILATVEVDIQKRLHY